MSTEGRTRPDAELSATIQGYFAPWADNGNEHPRCRFPGRYFWLSRQLPLPDYHLREPRCRNLERWALFHTVRSVSLLLVSGYFGNPASTFGHAFLKLNTDSPDDQTGLFDMTLNYGALVPENENALRYVIRGLFGGYEAGFSDKYFYTQDLVYSRTEFRDIWDYRLNLTDEERTLLILHIWEIAGKKFTYYFLDKNCAFRLGELLDLVLPEDLLGKRRRFWYVPVELFHRLQDMDRIRWASGRDRLIRSVRFIPSSQRSLFHQLEMLTPEELGVLNTILREGGPSLSAHLERLDKERQIMILDGLLAYQQYRLIAEEPTPDPQRKKFKDQILLQRLQLPSRPKAVIRIPELPSPADGSRPLEWGLRLAVTAGGESFLRLNWSPFKQEVVGQNSLEGDELIVFDLAIGLFEDEQNIFVDQFDLIRILNLNTLTVPVADESPWSWQVRLGMDRHKEDDADRYDGVASFGVGRAHKWNETLTLYGMVDLAGHSLFPNIRLRPHLGMRWDFGRLRAWLYFGWQTSSYEGDISDVWGGKVQYSLGNRSSVHTEFSSEKAARASVGWNWYW